VIAVALGTEALLTNLLWFLLDSVKGARIKVLEISLALKDSIWSNMVESLSLELVFVQIQAILVS